LQAKYASPLSDRRIGTGVIPETRYSEASDLFDRPGDRRPGGLQWSQNPFLFWNTAFRGGDATPPATALFRGGLLVAYAILVGARIPQVFLKGRFWAEEGVIYFLNGRDLPWYDALFAVHTGYLNLAASIATLLAARIVPIEQAPWVSSGFALLLQLCPPLLLLTSRLTWLRTRWALATALLLLLATTPSGEVWINSITSQFHLALCSALILALPLRGGAAGWFRGALLVLAPLSGPTSSILAPLFIVRGYFDRSWQRLVQGIVLGCAGAVQLLMILQHPEPGREIGIGPQLLALVVYVKQVLLPFLGTNRTHILTEYLADDFLAGRTPWIPLLASVTCMAALVMAAWRCRNTEVRWLIAAGTVLLATSYFGALGQHIQLLSVRFGDRYSYAPTALLGLALLGVSLTARGWLSGLCAILVCLAIWTGMNEYFSPGAGIADGSSWQAEIARWQANPSYRVQFWPSVEPWRWPIRPMPGPGVH
jgi:hypothetical protein